MPAKDSVSTPAVGAAGKVVRMKERCSLQYLVICMISLTAALGCTSSLSKEFPRYTYEQITPRDLKPSVSYEILGYSEGGAFFGIGSTNFSQEVYEVLRKSKLFSKISAGMGPETYHLSIELQAKGSPSLLSVVLSISTMAIIPGYTSDEYVLTVLVHKGNKLLKQYQYKRHIETWVHLFLVFGTHPATAIRETMDDMLLNLLHDMQKDQILTSSRSM